MRIPFGDPGARMLRFLRPSGGRRPNDSAGAPDAPSTVPDVFCRVAPAPQNAVDIFKGSWSSILPPPYEKLTGGYSQLFEDGRIDWAVEQLGGVDGLRIVELGPLEGGHTYMLDRLGAAEIVAVEANQSAFLRCLVVKELLSIPSARFLCGDFIPFLEEAARDRLRWDLCLASGVLYHQQDPVALLEAISHVTDRMILWTHYFDQTILQRHPETAERFTDVWTATTAGFTHKLHRQEYREHASCSGFPGGSSSWSAWMEREEILAAVSHLGFRVSAIGFEDLDHPFGPCFSFIAERDPSLSGS